MIEALKKEYETLSFNHKLVSSNNDKTKIAKIIRNSEKVLIKYCEKIEREKANLKETEHQIKKLEKQVFGLRPKQITDQQCNIRIQSGKKTIETLKNTLDNCVKRFCVTLAENRKLREEIDHLLKERERFNCLYEKRLLSLENGKKMIFDLVERATLAYDQREEWCNKLAALNTRTHNDTLMHNREMRELQRRLDYDTSLQEFLQIKGQKRILRDLEVKERKRQENERELAEKELKSLQETLEMIKNLTGEKDIERLLQSYVKQEEENFALFNYVNEITAELEDLEKRIREILEEITQQKEINEIRKKQQKNTVHTLNEQLIKIKMEGNDAKIELDNKKLELREFLTQVKDLFLLLNCEQGPVLELLGNNNIEITNNNVFVFLEMIERKIENVLHNKMLI